MGRGVTDFLNVPKVFKVFLRCSGWVFYSGMSSGFFRRCSWFSERCSGVFRGITLFQCSSVPCSGVPGITACRSPCYMPICSLQDAMFSFHVEFLAVP